MNIDKTFDQWILSKRELLNPGSLGAPAFNIELVPEHEAVWQAGDIAEIQPGNSPERIRVFMQKYQIAAGTQAPSLQQSIEQVLWDRDLTQAEPLILWISFSFNYRPCQRANTRLPAFQASRFCGW